MAKRGFGCGRPQCGASTGLGEEPTFGVGFDFMTGYFDEPCEQCARAFEKACPEYGPCWPPPGMGKGGSKRKRKRSGPRSSEV